MSEEKLRPKKLGVKSNKLLDYAIKGVLAELRKARKKGDDDAIFKHSAYLKDLRELRKNPDRYRGKDGIVRLPS